jgi:two-component system chemotaxis response regulator CheB
LIVIGTSLGGLHALQLLLRALPRVYPYPVAIVQHRVKSAESGLRQLLQRGCALEVVEPEDKDPLRAGVVYLAPADYHLLVDRQTAILSTDGRVNHARPAIDVLFESAAIAFGNQLTGVVLTGSNEDGARGARLILQHGGRLLIQDPTQSESGIMPAAALALTGEKRCYTLEQIASELATR